MKALFFILIMLFNFSGHSMDISLKENLPSYEIYPGGITTEFFGEVAPGVYAGQTRVGNEIVYFGMERVDEKNIENWNKYVRYSDSLTKNSRGILAVWPSHIAKIREVPFSQLQKITGFTEESELSEFLDKLEKVVQENKNIVDGLKGVPTGIAGFSIQADGNYYVVYVSKKPVTSRFPFPDNLPEFFPSLKKYYEYFGDLLMIVRSEIETDGDSYSNRGIFKNPISFIEDGNKYPGLSMKLHGFSALVAQHISKNKQYMSVAPAPAMRSIILKNKGWHPGDLTIDGRDFFDFSPEELNDFKDTKNVFAKEPHFRIKIDALIRLFRGGVVMATSELDSSYIINLN